MRIAITDDEDIYLDQLEHNIKTQLIARGITDIKISRYHSGEELLAAWTPGMFQIIFLDIYMDAKTGVDTARVIRETDDDVILVFCTTSNEFAAQSYEVNAGFYLQKPLSEEVISMMFDRIDISRVQSRQMVTLPDGKRCILYDIAYTAYSNHTVTICLKSGASHSLYASQADIEKLLLSHKDFIVVNRGNIVNLNLVDSVTKDSVLLNDVPGTNLPISRSKSKQLATTYATFKLNQMAGM